MGQRLSEARLSPRKLMSTILKVVNARAFEADAASNFCGMPDKELAPRQLLVIKVSTCILNSVLLNFLYYREVTQPCPFNMDCIPAELILVICETRSIIVSLCLQTISVTSIRCISVPCTNHNVLELNTVHEGITGMDNYYKEGSILIQCNTCPF